MWNYFDPSFQFADEKRSFDTKKSDREWKGLEELLEFFLNSQPGIYIRSCGKVKEDL